MSDATAAAAANTPVAEVLRAVDVLFSDSTDSGAKDKANQWLLAFKREKQAWTVANAILRQPNLHPNAYYFAAYTLRHKIQFDFADLTNSEDRKALRKAVLTHASNHIGDPIRMQLALAISGLAINMITTEWADALKDIVQGFGNVRTAMVLLDILTVLPEECENPKMAISRRVQQRAAKSIATHTHNILSILKKYMTSAGSDVTLQKKVYRCFLSWVRHGNISPQALVQDPLFRYTFQAVHKDELFEISLEVLGELVNHTQDMKMYQPAVRALVPQILSLSSKYDEALRIDDTESCKSLCRLFVEFGEVYMPLILEGREEASKAVSILLKCTDHPDKNIASMTFNFWYTLSREVIEVSNQSIRELFSRPFIELVGRLKKVMEYPCQVTNFNDDKEISEYKRFRYLAADILVDTVGVVGIKVVLKLLLQEIHKSWAIYQKDTTKWHGVEACLYCFRSVARRVPTNESEILPQLMKFILIPQLEKHSALRYTATLIVGRFNLWMNNHPDFIKPLLTFVVAGLSNDILLVVSSAAYAFNYVCMGCAEKLASGEKYLQALFDVYNRSRNLRIQERKEIVEGVTAVIAKLPIEGGVYLQALTGLIKPLVQVLHGSLETKDVQNDERKTKVSHALDLIAQSFMTLPDGVGCEQVSLILRDLNPTLDRIMLRYLQEDALMERVCRCWKYGIRASKLYFKPMLVPLLTKLAKLFPEYPHSSFLYIVCVCVNEFGSIPEYHPLMQKAYVAFSRHGMATLKSAEDFRQNPDVVGDFFDMQKRYLVHCPNIVFSSQDIIPHVFQCAVTGIGVQHKDACSMLMKFFATFIKIGSEIQKGIRKIENGNGVDLVQKIMVHFGENLSVGLLQCIAGKVPSSRNVFVIEVVEALIVHCRGAAQMWFQKALTKLPPTENPNHKQVDTSNDECE